MKPPPRAANLPLNVLLFVSYLALNISLNVLNKWILTYYGFGFPLLLTMAHMMFIIIALLPVMLTRRYRELHSQTLKKQWLSLLLVATCFALNIGLNNVSLTSLSLSLNQVIRSAVPVVTAVVSIGIENRKLTRKELLSLILLATGVGIAVYEGSSTENSFQGVALCFFATICHALTMASAGKILSSDKLDVVRLTFYMAPLSCFVMSPFYFKMEFERYQSYVREHNNSFFGLLTVGCAVALAYNLVHYLMIKHTSAVTTTVLGELKIIIILLLSALFLGEDKVWNASMVVGFVTAVVGFCLYSHCRLESSNTQWQPIIKGVPELAPSLTEHPVLRNPLLLNPLSNKVLSA